jgi:hypothetical protein
MTIFFIPYTHPNWDSRGSKNTTRKDSRGSGKNDLFSVKVRD